jgi:glycosyl transferase family 25
MTLFDYFDRIAIVHLPERVDRLAALKCELGGLGLEFSSDKVSVPDAPIPREANGFASRGVFGNFLSHLGILEKAYADGLDTVLILEDDAIFSRRFALKQEVIARELRSNAWDTLFVGHSIRRGLPQTASGLVRFSGSFLLSHCYGVHRNIMPKMIDYFHQTAKRDQGHPEGGKMYIDGAHTMFRRLHPETICIVTSPCLSVQRGSPSGIASDLWRNRQPLMKTTARSLRDELWRIGLITIGPQQAQASWTRIDMATPWPERS